jgi:hypothetical protein
MKHRGSAVTENSSAKYPKNAKSSSASQSVAYQLRRQARPRTRAANTSGINICADRWESAVQKKF